MSKKEIGEILQRYKVIAVVGLSGDENKPSHEVAAYMQHHGYHIIPVNPNETEVLGEKSYPSLLEIPAEIQRQIEIVDIFRRAETVSPIVEQVMKLKAANGKPSGGLDAIGHSQRGSSSEGAKSGANRGNGPLHHG